MAVNTATCPRCGLSDHTYKLSEIYIEALDALKNGKIGPILPQVMNQGQVDARGILKTQALRSVISSFGPPSGGQQLTRPVNPNLVMMGFTLIAIFFLVQIFLSQRELFLPILILVLLFYSGFFIFRKRITGKYTQQMQENINLKRMYEAAIGQWMLMYYCARDEGVFAPNNNELIPLHAMKARLLEDAKKR
jgi:hypothetical protein